MGYRSEAKSVPNLLTSATVEESNLYQDYSRGYYDDGAYTAMPLPLAEGTTQIDDDADIDPQEAYYARLREQLRSLHAALHASPPPLAPNESTTAIATKLNDGASSRIWRMTLFYTQPTSTLLSQLDQDTVVAGIAALEKHMAWKTLEKESFLGAWAWGLLARCRDVGMMGSEEVGVIRDLGKKARAMVRLLAAGLGGAQAMKIEETAKFDGDDEGLMDEAAGHDPQEDGRGVGKDEAEVVDEVKTMDSLPFQQDPDLGSSRSTGPAQDFPNGVAADLSETDPLNSVEKDRQLPSVDDDEIAEAQEKLLTTLHETTRSLSPDPPTSFLNDRSSSSPLKTVPSSNDQASVKATQRRSSPAHETSSPGPVPLTMRVAATLDMIITIVGETYGQRDLLEGRMVWD